LDFIKIQQQNMSQPLIIVVTGSNRGLGQGITQLLAKTHHPRPLHIYATSRRGAHLDIQPVSPNEIRYAKLDVTDTSSITAFISDTLQKEDKIDVLINNAGICSYYDETPEIAEQTIKINYYGTKEMCQLFLAQGKMNKTPGSRIVNISSAASSLLQFPDPMKPRICSAKSIADIDALAEDYLSAIKSQKQEEAGFGTTPKSYQLSKALVNVLTAALARENEGVIVNCCYPGWVDTDMGVRFGKPPKTLEEGARIPVRLAIGDLGVGGDGDGGLGRDGGKRVNGKYVF
jgi:carbonyl reductase 1